jgi:hypothetical protein
MGNDLLLMGRKSLDPFLITNIRLRRFPVSEVTHGRQEYPAKKHLSPT